MAVGVLERHFAGRRPAAGIASLVVHPAFPVWPPVVLAPMAGITNQAYRRVCRDYGAALYVAEMVTSRALVERSAETMRMVEADPDEPVRSVQVYGVDPDTVGQAVKILVEEDLADHVDLNFGCPVPKVTRKGGGAALPWKLDLFRAIVSTAVRTADAAGTGVPVTVKMRKGIDDEHLTYLEAGRIAAGEGAAWVALHGRTAAQAYSGTADWAAVGALVEALDVPVLGNGDVWSAADARRMMDETGAAGVVVGRGCLGRPWLFAELAAEFGGEPAPSHPNLGEVVRVLRRHAALLALRMGEAKAARDIRKHMAWYFKGFGVGSEIRARLGTVGSLAELDDLLGRLDPLQPSPVSEADVPRGRGGSPRRVALPDGWLDDRVGRPDADAESDVSGG